MKEVKRLPKGTRLVLQGGYKRKGGIAKYCAFDKEGNMVGGGLLYRSYNLRDAKRELLDNINKRIGYTSN